jgi:hypothetical protein
MANYCFVAPILPNGMEKMQTFIKNEVPTPSHDEFMRSAGLSREQVWVQHTPMGDFAVVSFEVEDAGKTFAAIATSKHAYAVKFRNHLKAVHGIDVNQPMELNERVVNWQAK